MSHFHSDEDPYESAATDWTLGDPPAFTWPPADDERPMAYAPQAPARPYGEVDEPGVFGDTETPDGLVYTAEEVSPELQWQHQRIEVPLPPVRDRPQPRSQQPVEVWKPGPEPVPDTPTSETARRVLVGLIPLVVIALLALLVTGFAKMYGL